MTNLEFTEFQVHVLHNLYVDWPASGVQGVLDNILPQEYRVALINSNFVTKELKSLMLSWEAQGLEENTPFKPVEEPFRPNLVGAF